MNLNIFYYSVNWKIFFALITYKYSRIVLALILKEFTYINSFYWHFIYPFELCNLLWIWSEKLYYWDSDILPRVFSGFTMSHGRTLSEGFFDIKKKKKKLAYFFQFLCHFSKTAVSRSYQLSSHEIFCLLALESPRRIFPCQYAWLWKYEPVPIPQGEEQYPWKQSQ